MLGVYYVDARTLNKARAASAAAAVDYNVRFGRYAKGRDPVLYVESGHMPPWARVGRGDLANSAARAYWRSADRFERANGRLAKLVVVALPNALTLDAQIELARGICRAVTNGVDGGNLPWTLAVHGGVDSAGRSHNPHCHLAISERVNDGIERDPHRWFAQAAPRAKGQPEKGGARKTKLLRSREWLIWLRRTVAAVINRALELAGVSIRVDHRSILARRMSQQVQPESNRDTAVLERRGGGADQADVALEGIGLRKAESGTELPGGAISVPTPTAVPKAPITPLTSITSDFRTDDVKAFLKESNAGLSGDTPPPPPPRLWPRSEPTRLLAGHAGVRPHQPLGRSVELSGEAERRGSTEIQFNVAPPPATSAWPSSPPGSLDFGVRSRADSLRTTSQNLGDVANSLRSLKIGKLPQTFRQPTRAAPSLIVTGIEDLGSPKPVGHVSAAPLTANRPTSIRRGNRAALRLTDNSVKDCGDRIEVSVGSMQFEAVLARLVVVKRWSAVHLQGPEPMRRAAWLVLTRAGVRVSGYRHTVAGAEISAVTVQDVSHPDGGCSGSSEELEGFQPGPSGP